MVLSFFLLLGVVDLLAGATVSAKELSSFGGSVQWLNLLKTESKKNT